MGHNRRRPAGAAQSGNTGTDPADRGVPRHRRRRPGGPAVAGAQLFRMVSYCYALGFHIAINSDLLRSGIAWALFVVLTATTVACGVGYYRGFARNRYWVVARSPSSSP